MPATELSKPHQDAVLDKRRSGLLLHPTSLPGGLVTGTLGPDAYRFVDFLAGSGITVWQTLPIGPTHADLSPYQCLSVHAGDTFLISLELLVEAGWLNSEDISVNRAEYDDHGLKRLHHDLLSKARQGFLSKTAAQDRQAYEEFITEQAYWLEDYSLFQALRQDFQHNHWLHWPQEFRDRDKRALTAARPRLEQAIEQVRFEQFVFFQQWIRLKRYANEKGILLFGDLPIFVAHDSAEVWANKDQFALDENGEMVIVAGVPPDYFSETGQLWGNPHYDWEHMRANHFRWWKQRLTTQFYLFDLVRIDHFRGFESYWEVPAGAETAMNGHWVQAPGDELFEALHKHFQPLPLVAEDLGLITPEVIALRKRHGFPGMKILQFAFDSDAHNPYLPHQHEENGVVYTGTHDNNTTIGWYKALPRKVKHRVMDYLSHPQEEMPWPLIRCALASVAQLAILPMQDVLALDGTHRMNTPGTVEGNWRWRFSWDQVTDDIAPRLHHLMNLYGR